MSDLPTYTLERVFDASRELVWKTWTDPKLLARWYVPRDNQGETAATIRAGARSGDG